MTSINACTASTSRQSFEPVVEVTCSTPRAPSNCVANPSTQQMIQQSSRPALITEKDDTRTIEEFEDSSHFSSIDSHYLSQSPRLIDSNTPPNNLSCSPFRKASSASLSSVNTAIRLPLNTPTPAACTSRTAHGSFLEPESDSSQLLTELAAQSKAEDDLPTSDDPNLEPSSDGFKIQFHDVVRIAGGISSNPKRKKVNKNTSSGSPSRYHGFWNGSPHHSNRYNSENIDSHGIRTANQRQGRRLDTHESSFSPNRRTPSTNRPLPRRTGSPSTRSSFSHCSQTDSLPSSFINHPGVVNPPQSTGSLIPFTRSISLSSSVTGSANVSTLMSRSSSPASSLYLPLRIPIVRAPAPFFGPTPERVALVRERRQVAQRDAERAKGGWRAWWNNWYYQSDRSATRKGKAKQDCTHVDDQPCHSHQTEYSDSDDGSCYHDVILEHERKKMERKLEKLKQTQPHIKHKDSKSSRHQNKERKSNSSTNASSKSRSWLSWASIISADRTPRPPNPPKLPTPVSGILRRPTLNTSYLPPGPPVSPFLSEQVDGSHSERTNDWPVPYEQGDSRTPLLTQTQLASNYGNLSPNPSDLARYASSHLSQTSNPPKPKTDVDAQFGLAPRRWFTIRWWRWKICHIFKSADYD